MPNPTLSADALRDLQATYDTWLGMENSLERLTVRTMLSNAAFNALPALLSAAGEVEKLRAEIDEALQLTESCSSLKQMAAACIEGAYLASTLPRPASGPAEAVAWAAVAPEGSIVKTGLCLSSISEDEREAWRKSGWGGADDSLEEIRDRGRRDEWDVVRIQIVRAAPPAAGSTEG